MPAYSGKHQYTGADGQTISQGPCQLNFDQENGSVTPSGGLPILFDLGDVDTLAAGEWDLHLKLYTGHSVALRQFGPAFGRMAEELTAAWRNRTVQCLLLEDLEEIGRYNGAVSGTPGMPSAVPSEIRLYKTNFAVLPASGIPIQWRLADVDSVVFDPSSYSVAVLSEGRKLVLSKLGPKTDEFVSILQNAFDALRLQSADILHKTFPFLNADQLQRLLRAMPEGRSAKVSSLAGIHPKLSEAFLARAVTPKHKPYFEALQSRSGGASVMTGYKIIRQDDDGDEEGQEEAPAEAAEETPQESPLFFWFFFPLANAVAWEPTTGSGRATYFFSMAGEQAAPIPVEESIASLTRGLALVNFRREPIYLPDDSLEMQPRFHRYATGARKLPDLRALRAAFRGRAIHSSLEKWAAQVDAASK